MKTGVLLLLLMTVSLSVLSQFSTRLLVIEGDTGVFMSVDTARYRATLIDKGFEYYKLFGTCLEKRVNDSIRFEQKDIEIRALNTKISQYKAFSDDLEARSVSFNQSLIKCEDKRLKQQRLIFVAAAVGFVIGILL